VLGVVTGLAGIFATIGLITHWTWALGASAALAGVAAGLGKFMPSITAIGAAAQVTPLSDPRDHQMNRLTAEEYGRHAAPVNPADELVRVTEDLGLYNDIPRTDDRSASMGPDLPTTRVIPEQVVEGRRLGRHVNHDPRSLDFLVQPTGVSQTKVWDRKIPILDQGNLGSCTGNATTGVLGSEPFYSSLTPAQQSTLNEGEAVQLYSLATALDGYPGQYPPDDTGSDGLSVAKAAQKSGFISAYQHITSVDAAKTAIMSGPFIVGTNWLSGMDTPDASGLVHAVGDVRGGHEYECIGYHADTDLWEFVNSWGESWGKAGHFFYSSADFAALLADSGDATTFVPVAAPTPPPVPPTPPAPPTPPSPAGFPLADWQSFESHHRSEVRWQKLRAAVDAWLTGTGA
jgi:hypothetical protein